MIYFADIVIEEIFWNYIYAKLLSKNVSIIIHLSNKLIN
jgi:hypothetical protein